VTDGRPILVVDDDAGIRDTVSEILDLEGYAVETAADGEEALQVLEHSSPAAVLLDMRMPVLDGWGFAKAVKERGLQVPILVMTAARDARRWAEEIDADGHLSKPFDLNDLLRAVGDLVDGPDDPSSHVGYT
jgi:two-component system chemotaxis response regulator CheY